MELTKERGWSGFGVRGLCWQRMTNGYHCNLPKDHSGPCRQEWPMCRGPAPSPESLREKRERTTD